MLDPPRDDVFTIQAVVAYAEIKILETTGTNPYDILKAKRDRYGRGYVLTCNSEEALWFYQAAIENCDDLPQDHKGFKCYKPSEKPPGHQIMGKLYMSHWRNREKICFYFKSASRVAAVNDFNLSIL